MLSGSPKGMGWLWGTAEAPAQVLSLCLGYVGLHLGQWLTATCRNAVPQEKLRTMAAHCSSALTEPVLPLQLKGREKMSTPHPGEHPWVWVQAVGSAHCGGFGKGSVQPSQAHALVGCSCPTCPHCTARGPGPARCSSQGGARRCCAYQESPVASPQF